MLADQMAEEDQQIEYFRNLKHKYQMNLISESMKEKAHDDKHHLMHINS